MKKLHLLSFLQNRNYVQKLYSFVYYLTNIFKKGLAAEICLTLSENAVSKKNSFKILEADYKNLKDSYKDAHVSETIHRINFKLTKNILKYIYTRYTYIVCKKTWTKI